MVQIFQWMWQFIRNTCLVKPSRMLLDRILTAIFLPWVFYLFQKLWRTQKLLPQVSGLGLRTKTLRQWLSTFSVFYDVHVLLKIVRLNLTSDTTSDWYFTIIRASGEREKRQSRAKNRMHWVKSVEVVGWQRKFVATNTISPHLLAGTFVALAT